MIHYCAAKLINTFSLVGAVVASLMVTVATAWVPQIVNGRGDNWQGFYQSSSKSGLNWWIMYSSNACQTELTTASNVQLVLAARTNPEIASALESAAYPEITPPYWSRASRKLSESDVDDGSSEFDSFESASGWPLHALMWRVDFPIANGPGTLTYGAPIKRLNSDVDYIPPLDKVILPLRPIWPGMAVDAVFFLACILTTLSMIHIIRYTYRKHNGRCVWCGYVKKHLVMAVCPECGSK